MKIPFPRIALVAALAIAAALPVAAAPTTVYSKVTELTIRATEAPTSNVVAKVGKEDALRVLREDKFRYFVQTASGAQGFVSRLQVTDAAPGAGRASLGGLVREDRSPREMRTAAAGRGLVEITEKMAAQKGIPPETVEKIRAVERRSASVTTEELAAFLREGGLPQ